MDSSIIEDLFERGIIYRHVGNVDKLLNYIEEYIKNEKDKNRVNVFLSKLNNSNEFKKYILKNIDRIIENMTFTISHFLEDLYHTDKYNSLYELKNIINEHLKRIVLSYNNNSMSIYTANSNIFLEEIGNIIFERKVSIIVNLFLDKHNMSNNLHTKFIYYLYKENLNEDIILNDMYETAMRLSDILININNNMRYEYFNIEYPLFFYNKRYYNMIKKFIMECSIEELKNNLYNYEEKHVKYILNNITLSNEKKSILISKHIELSK